jgi:hypothetical protein
MGGKEGQGAHLAGCLVRPSPAEDEGEEAGDDGAEGPRGGADDAATARPPREPLHGEKEMPEVPRSSSRRHGQDEGRGRPELLTGAVRCHGTGEVSGDAARRGEIWRWGKLS